MYHELMTYFDKYRGFLFSLLALPVFRPSNEDFLSCETDLAHWGLKDPEEVGYISVGIIHKKSGDELVVYDVRAEKPVIQLPLKPRSCIPPFQGDVFLLDDFHRGNTNRLGGYFSRVVRAPSESHVTIDRVPDGRRALCFSYNQKSPGFAGFWIHLFNSTEPPVKRIFMDAAPFQYLTFSIKGQEGGEGLVLQVADCSWERKEDSLRIGPVGQFLPSEKIQNGWQRAWVPLERFPERIKKGELASLVFLAQPGEGKVYIGDVAFTRQKDAPIPSPSEKEAFKPSAHRGMWLWNTKNLLGSEAEQSILVNFCRKNGITEVFLQLPYDVKEKDGDRVINWDRSETASLLSRLQNAGIKIHALDGAPHYALREWHAHVLATVEAVIQYNKTVNPRERFEGVRFDIEPYIMQEFSGVQKQSIMEQYLELLRRTKKLTDPAGLEFGVDIPFWFDQNNEFFEPIAEIQEHPLTEWILDIVDNVGIMDYRTEVYGADGIIAHALNELRYASAKGKKIFIGLETTMLPDETILEFGKKKGPSRLFFEKKGGSRILLRWIPVGKEQGGQIGLCLFQQKRVFIPAGKLTFAGKSVEELKDIMEKTEPEFRAYPAFYGYAIHSYESYKALSGTRN